MTLIEACRAGTIELIASDVHGFEIGQSASEEGRTFSRNVLGIAVHYAEVTASTARLAETFESAGVIGADAFHLAAAIESDADYLCTTDDRFLKRSIRLNTSSVSVVSPLYLLEPLRLL